MATRAAGGTRSRALVAALSIGVALGGAAWAERLPMQTDVDLCAVRASQRGDNALSGSVRLQILVRADGKVYAAFIHSVKDADDKVFDYCLASTALLWQFPPAGLDTSAPFPIKVVPGGATSGDLQNERTPPQVFLPAAHPEIEPAELDVARAQASLNLLEDATAAERGQGALSVRRYQEALDAFRAALGADGSDRLALRGLAQALVESGGDLAEARQVAQKLVSLAPGSVVGAEAMIRVCAAAQDDACVYAEWQRALTTQDLAPRSRIVQDELRPLVEKSARRLRAAALERRSQAAAEGTGVRDAGPPAPHADPCAQETDDSKQALCEVKRCLGAGSALYAQEISQDGVEYAAGDWRFKEAGKDRLLVTRPIESKAKEGAPAVHRDAIFLVKLGTSFSIAPASPDARAIARAHNACVSAGPAPAEASLAPDAGPSVPSAH